MSSGKCEAGSQAEMTVGGNPSVDTGSSSLIDELARYTDGAGIWKPITDYI
ncbi:hypothetical protein T08_4566 [Trichinella sp. T8]|nr:hypothetical protein T08_4566 [Trichinella sp. T8]